MLPCQKMRYNKKDLTVIVNETIDMFEKESLLKDFPILEAWLRKYAARKILNHLITEYSIKFPNKLGGNFINPIASFEHFAGIFWEIYFSLNLVSNGLKLDSKEQSNNGGPDFIANDKVYIECTAPQVNESVVHTDRRHSQDADDIKISRITGAIEGKIKQYYKWKSKGKIKEHMPFILAINSGEISHETTKHQLFYMLQAVFGGLYKCNSSGLWKTRKISKGNNKSIEANYFLNEEYSFISGIIFTHMSLFNYCFAIERSIIEILSLFFPSRSQAFYQLFYINNPLAKYPIDSTFTSSFFEYKAKKLNEGKMSVFIPDDVYPES